MTVDSRSALRHLNKPHLVRKAMLLLAASVLGVVTTWLAPAGLPELARPAMGIFVFAAFLWATEALPLYATSLCVVGLEILLLAEDGGLATSGGLSYKQFLTPFASGVIILFMGGFLLSRAVTKYKLDGVIARRLIHPFAGSPLSLIFGVILVTGVVSMWMSNTATAAMMLAIILPIVQRIDAKDPLRQAILLAVPFGANIGGLGTPIGTPPNAVALAQLRQMGFDMGFVEWMLMAVPMMLLMMAIGGFLLYFLFRPQANYRFDSGAIEQPPIRIKGWVVLGILAITVTLWLTSQLHGIREAVVALIAAALLTTLGVLDRNDVRSIDWDILILMWGGLSLGSAMQATGLDVWIGQGAWGSLAAGVIPTIFVVLAVVLSTFMSNTATANLLIPIAIAMSASNPIYLAILTAFGCSFAMALPVSTPPNAIAFSSGELSSRNLLISGGIMSVIGCALLILGYRIVLPWFV